VLRAGVAVVVACVSIYLADEDRDTEGWLIILGLVVVAFILAGLLVRGMLRQR
jgi:hypothetical protein